LKIKPDEKNDQSKISPKYFGVIGWSGWLWLGNGKKG
jgi:hypothetical protein